MHGVFGGRGVGGRGRGHGTAVRITVLTGNVLLQGIMDK